MVIVFCAASSYSDTYLPVAILYVNLSYEWGVREMYLLMWLTKQNP